MCYFDTLSVNQIWLNWIVDHCQFGYITKLKKQSNESLGHLFFRGKKLPRKKKFKSKMKDIWWFSITKSEKSRKQKVKIAKFLYLGL
jgi:hypothetical protein